MTMFEEIGVSRQYDAASTKEAKKSFAHSCDLCCYQGRHIDCDKCGIAFAHNLIISNFNNITKGAHSR